MALLCGHCSASAAADDPQTIAYNGNGSDLQKTIELADAGSTIACDPKRQMEISAPIKIKKPITLQGVNAALPRGLSKTSLFVVEAEGVTIKDSEFHGNYDSVPQAERAPLFWFQAGKFRIDAAAFTMVPKTASISRRWKGTRGATSSAA